MSIPPDVAAARRTITIACAALAAFAVVGALIFSSLGVGNDCGNGWSAVRKPLPQPLLTPEEIAVIQRDKLSPYEVGAAKSKPIEDCHRAGAKRLITSGLGASLVLLPIGGVMAYLYLPRREDLVFERFVPYEAPPQPRAARRTEVADEDEDEDDTEAPTSGGSLMSNWHNQPPR